MPAPQTVCECSQDRRKIPHTNTVFPDRRGWVIAQETFFHLVMESSNDILASVGEKLI